MDKRRARWALYFTCLGAVMTVVDTTIVVVALPSMIKELHLSSTSSTWILNAYTLSFGGFLLLSGRLGDLYGPRRLFLAGVVLFTAASLACASANTQILLVAARAVQGLGGAVVSAMALSLILNLFSITAERARALGIYTLVCSAGGGAGDLLGGLVTGALDWRWIFLINLPIGIVVYVCCATWLPADPPSRERRSLDAIGATTITLSLALMIAALVRVNELGWLSPQTCGLIGLSAVLLVVFVRAEARAREPLVPLAFFRQRSFTTANLIGILWTAGTTAWFVVSALYLQRVLGYDPFHVGLCFLPSETLMAGFSAGMSDRIVTRFGIRRPLSLGLTLVALGLTLFARAPLHATFLADVLPAMLLLGLGAGMASTPLLLAATRDLENKDSGLASGIVNSSFMLGGALGLATLVTLSEARSATLLHSGTDTLTALTSGFHLAFALSAALTATAAILTALMPSTRSEVETVDYIIQH
jgi:EmrB/QacA subfamily drug resistance transporter